MSKIVIKNCKAKIVRESDVGAINMCSETKCPFWKDDSNDDDYCSITELVSYGSEITINIKEVTQPYFKKEVIK